MSSIASPVVDRPAGGLRQYLELARIDHWVKQIFVVPGVVLALLLTDAPLPSAGSLAAALLAVCLLASANYVINEWLDRHRDAEHPLKCERPAVRYDLKPGFLYALYVLLAVLGLGLALAQSRTFAVLGGLLLIAGLVYNVPPLRLKDRAFLDVIVEAFNNPLRLTLGWAAVDPTTLPPSSVMLCYWSGGAFLMTIKRLAERRYVVERSGEATLAAYRPALARAGEQRLFEAASLYSLISVFALTVFLVKYRIEYLLLVPIVAALFALYLAIGLEPESAAQAPEKLWRERGLVVTMAVLIGAFLALTWIDLPILEALTEPHYIRLPDGAR